MKSLYRLTRYDIKLSGINDYIYIIPFGDLHMGHYREYLLAYRGEDSLCPKGDSNSYTLRRASLKRVRLPIPPFGQCVMLIPEDQKTFILRH